MSRIARLLESHKELSDCYDEALHHPDADQGEQWCIDQITKLGRAMDEIAVEIRRLELATSQAVWDARRVDRMEAVERLSA